MSEYIVSARKYRPDSFGSLIGQDNIAQTLKNSILRGQLAHAYLFCGPRGVGKTSTARIFAKTINCLHPGPDMEPCGECESCVSFAEGRSYCIYELDAASNNSVEDIKVLMDKVQIPPQVGKYSVYIIDEVHMLSTAAFNAFLKTLEEPPSYAIFILCTTEKHKVLPTILSRCQTYDFNRIGVPDMVRNLRAIADKEGVHVDDESLHVIAQKADGAMRDALTIFDQTVAFCGNDIQYADVIRNLGVLDYEYSFRLVDAFLAKDYASALMIFDEILAKGFNALHFVSALGEHLRDLLVAHTGGLESLLELPASFAGRYREQAARCSVQFLYQALDITTACEAGYRTSTNQRLHIEFALMKLAFIAGVPASEPVAAPVAPAAPVAAPAAAVKPAAPAAAPVAAPAAPAPAPAKSPAASEEPEVIELLDIEDDAPQPKAEEPAAPAVSKPAAAPAEEPAPAEPAPRRRSSRSIKSLMDASDEAAAVAAPVVAAVKPAAQADDSASPEQDAPVEAPAAPAIPTDEAVLDVWPRMVEVVSEGKPRLSYALNSAKLSFADVDGAKEISFEVVNDAQKRWIDSGPRRKMENALNGMLSTSCIRITVTLQPDEEGGPKIYLPSEKAKVLIDSNPEVRDLVKDLGLDAK